MVMLMGAPGVCGRIRRGAVPLSHGVLIHPFQFAQVSELEVKGSPPPEVLGSFFRAVIQAPFSELQNLSLSSVPFASRGGGDFVHPVSNIDETHSYSYPLIDT